MEDEPAPVKIKPSLSNYLSQSSRKPLQAGKRQVPGHCNYLNPFYIPTALRTNLAGQSEKLIELLLL